MIADKPAPTVETPDATERRLSSIFTRDEIRALNERSDAMGLFAVGSTWAGIVATGIVLVWARAQPLVVAVPVFVVGVVVLGGRHLALAILSHEAAHKSLFRTARLNEVVGDWLGGRAVGIDVRKYRAHHFVHHRRTRQPDDPDQSLVEGFPTTRASLARKLARDALGVTGLKFLLGRLMMDLGLIKWTVANDTTWLPREGRSPSSYATAFFRNAGGAIVVNAALFAVCAACGQAWLFGVWVLAYVTPFPLFLRIRSLAEHACTKATTDTFENTRTTKAGFLARATLAPLHVNYHLEHHALPSVPFYRLPAVHARLRERGAVGDAPGYLDVLRIVSSRTL